jgi:hypothetical protein
MTMVETGPPPAAIDCVSGEIEKVHEPCVTVKVCPAIVTAPLRSAPLFGVMDNTTTPSPVPDDPAVTPIQSAVDAADHVHVEPALTETVVVPPLAPALKLSGATEYVHGAAGWPIVNLLAPIRIVACRSAPVFAATLIWTSPVPVPLAPLMMVAHGALLVADQRHPAVVVTVIASVPPPEPTDPPADPSDTSHNAVPSACAIVTGCPATVTVPVRAGPRFGAAEIVTAADPLPPAVTLSQLLPLAVVHAQSELVVT